MVTRTSPLRVVQCWDDGNVDDIRLCDILRRHGATASFNLNPGLHAAVRHDVWLYKGVHRVRRLAWPELRSVYEGFTIANHSMTHPRPGELPPEAWRKEVVDARHKLQDHFQQPVLGFAYPYGNFTPEAMRTVADAGHIYARTCENATPCFPPDDPMRAPTDCHHLSPDFWTLYERAKDSPARVFYFWGHSYEFTSEALWNEFDAKMERIAADPDAVFASLPELFAAPA